MGPRRALSGEMPARLLLDTDVIVEHLRGRGKAGEWLDKQESDLLVSVITVAELFAGVKGERENQILDQFLATFNRRHFPMLAAVEIPYRRP